jgi:hypothetical protein
MKYHHATNYGWIPDISRAAISPLSPLFKKTPGSTKGKPQEICGEHEGKILRFPGLEIAAEPQEVGSRDIAGFIRQC